MNRKNNKLSKLQNPNEEITKTKAKEKTSPARKIAPRPCTLNSSSCSLFQYNAARTVSISSW